ncbi:hypothetical protein L596_013064 [Steinernema carpocapsae]|uniref:glutamine synthetase n=1 Tax=Steinernema carpocapsae TaxID=34508 RepID=A0A4U5NZ98_STECR|nr:hypothetical protein L596_013064 [Steinernema carpocapsae]
MTPSPRDLFTTKVAERYRKLAEIVSDCVCTYVWVDGTGENLRCKQRTMAMKPKSVEELPIWNFDGSSTGQASGVTNSDVLLKPVAMYPDPFRLGNCILVMCETLTSEGLPHPTNHRHKCAEVMRRVEAEKPWFGMEQEYTSLTLMGTSSAGLSKASQDPRAPITAALDLKRSSRGTSSKPTTQLVSTLESRSVEPTLKPCQDSGNTKSALA